MSAVAPIATDPPGKWERTARALGYAAVAAIGVSVLFDPPMLDPLGNVLTLVWALFIMSSVPCVWVAWTTHYRTEYILLPFFTVALIVSVIALWVHYESGDVTYTLPRVLAATALVCVFAARFFSLHRLVSTRGAGRTWMQRFFKPSPPSS